MTGEHGTQKPYSHEGAAPRQNRVDHGAPPFAKATVGHSVRRAMATLTRLDNAKDLSREPPRSPRVRLGGYALMARMIDKGRATINGTNGDFHFNCPVDNLLFSFKGVSGEDVRQALASGATDGEMVAWFDSHGRFKTEAEIQGWSDHTEATSPYDDREKRDWFIGECERLGLNPKHTTLFSYLEADDQQSYAQS